MPENRFINNFRKKIQGSLILYLLYLWFSFCQVSIVIENIKAISLDV